ncbi:hypothetical protein ABF162_25855 (plasmid) [Vibrio coralliilyticus]|uniref:hypothetical protein n=1 Tax=Vibrio coralliilyticus TaxID=190893 RepID=UPI000B0B17E2|nr:hypothetical protein [Vibrio coralliilyticus]
MTSESTISGLVVYWLSPSLATCLWVDYGYLSAGGAGRLGTHANGRYAAIWS